MRARLIIAVALGLLACSGLAYGQVFTFDEFGGGAFGPASFMADPGPGGLGAALTYPLPFPGTVGDLIITEPPGNAQNSDLIRWNGNASLIFYSDNVGGVDAPADTGLPGPNYPGPVVKPESGVEGGIQDVFYTPGPGMPGFDAAVAGATYHFVSDVPEPGSFAVLALAGCVMALTRRMRG